jgi:thiamine-monophosphate kinase
MKREFERIAALQARLRRTRDDIVVGMGDDAAVLEVSSARQVLTVDVAVEGVHFDRSLTSWSDIGGRAYMIAASDLAAMGARGRVALLALVLPSDVDDPALMELIDGAGRAADAVGAPIVGGNLSSGSELSITTTVIGEVDGAPLLRSGARLGHGIHVTGEIGGAALGLHCLKAGLPAGDHPQAAHCIAKYQRPQAAMETGQRLRGHATAAIDISDGLIQDLSHLCDASGVGAEIRVDLLPRPEGSAELGVLTGVDPLTVALTGGDDYELLFTAAPGDPVAAQLGVRIGVVTAGPGVTTLAPDGTPINLTHLGYEHFASVTDPGV